MEQNTVNYTSPKTYRIFEMVREYVKYFRRRCNWKPHLAVPS